MKIVLCIPSLRTAGAEKFVADLAVNLKRMGQEVYVALTRENKIGQYGNELKENKVKIVDLSGSSFFEMLRKQKAFLKKEKPDVIHANIGSMLHIMLASKIAKVPTRIYTVHNDAQLLFLGSKKRKFMYKVAFGLMKFQPVAICDTVKKSMVREFGARFENMQQVNNGVDIEKFHPSAQNREDESIRFVNTGTMYWIKNQIEILEVFSELVVKYPNIRLTILGDGEDRSKLESFIKEKDLQNVISMPGICADVDNYLRNSDVYISASITEGLPISMLEAMSSGLPIITSDAGGSVDLVKTGKNGIVYTRQYKDQLKAAMEEMILNPEKRKQYGMESRKIAEDWSLEKCAKGYLNLYRQIVER